MSEDNHKTIIFEVWSRAEKLKAFQSYPQAQEFAAKMSKMYPSAKGRVEIFMARRQFQEAYEDGVKV